MDLTTLPAPVFTSLDGVTQLVTAICYLAVGAAAWLHAKHDIRTQVFLAFSIANAIVLGLPTYWWLRGTTDPTQWPPLTAAIVMSGVGVAALVLFHFSQVFPRRRPWLRTSGAQIPAAYCIAPIATAALVWFAPSSADRLSVPYILALIVFGFPLLVLLGIVLPVAAMTSLVRSYRDIHREGLTRLKRPIEGILVSQIGGGTLTIVFAPVLARVAPNSAVETSLTLLIGILGLLTPVAFAAAVWKYDVLSLATD
ncbi:MAG: hypothetical protein ABI818_17000 [Acidobacteriota bacterium]